MASRRSNEIDLNGLSEKEAIEKLKKEIKSLKRSIFSSQLGLNEYCNRQDVGREEKEKQLKAKLERAKKKIASYYDLQEKLKNITLEGNSTPIEIESLSETMEISPFLQNYVTTFDNSYDIKNVKRSEDDYKEIPEEKKLVMTGSALYYMLKYSPENAGKTEEEIKEEALKMMAEKGIQKRKHNHKSKKAKENVDENVQKVEEVKEPEIVTERLEPTGDEIYKIEEEAIIKDSSKIKEQGDIENRVEQKVQEEIPSEAKETESMEPTADEIEEKKTDDFEDISSGKPMFEESEESVDISSRSNSENEPIITDSREIGENKKENVIDPEIDDVYYEPEDQAKDTYIDIEDEISKPDISAKEKVEEEKEEIEQGDTTKQPDINEYKYDYRKNLPSIIYSDIEHVDKVQKGIQSKICDNKGRFISSESGRVRNAIRRVAIATNSKDIDATKLLNGLYEKKGLFSKDKKVFSKTLPRDLEGSFKSFEGKFYAAIDDGNLSKEDQELIYEYMIKPRELASIKEEIKNGNVVVDDSEKEQSLNSNNDFFKDLSSKTKQPGIDIEDRLDDKGRSRNDIEKEIK